MVFPLIIKQTTKMWTEKKQEFVDNNLVQITVDCRQPAAIFATIIAFKI